MTTPRETGDRLRALGFKFESQMGGGCTAWSRPEADGGHVLLTLEGGGATPSSLDDTVLAGWYSADPKVELPLRHEEGVLRDLIERGVLNRE